MNNQVVFMITGSAGTGKSAMATRFQSIGEVMDLDYLSTCCGKHWVTFPELFDLAILRGCRVFCGTSDNWIELLGLIKRAKMQPVVFVLTPTESQGAAFMRRPEQKHRQGWNQRVWLKHAVEHVTKVRRICREIDVTCFQLQRTSDGTSPAESQPGRVDLRLLHSYFTVPKPIQFGWLPEGHDSEGLIGEFREFMRKHWIDIKSINASLTSTPIDLWAQIRGYKAFEKRALSARKRIDAVETNAGGGVPENDKLQ